MDLSYFQQFFFSFLARSLHSALINHRVLSHRCNKLQFPFSYHFVEKCFAAMYVLFRSQSLLIIAVWLMDIPTQVDTL